MTAETATSLPAAIDSSPRLLPDDDRAFFGADVYRSHAVPRAVVRPESIDELRALVTAAAEAGLAIHVRGGGVSYTDAHLPTREASMVVDTGALDRIVEINETDMTVTV